MGNKLLKQIEEGLTSDDENDIRSSCNTLAVCAVSVFFHGGYK